MSEKARSPVASSRAASSLFAAPMTGRPPTRPPSRPPARPGTWPLLAAKLAVAPLPEGIVVGRDRLWERLDAGVRGRITLVSAPAGWGKTVLLASWCRADRPTGGRSTAWLTIEPGDHGPRFWRYLTAALRGVTAGNEGVVDAVAGPAPVGHDRRRLEALAAELACRSEPVVLVLDDAHRILDDRHRADAPGLFADLDFLSRHAGDRLRLVLATRTDPLPTLPRWRLDGELTEIRASDLAFTVEEAAELLSVHGIRLPADQVAALCAGTEGWAAGLRFAALALRGHPEPTRLVAAFGGDDPSVAAYLTGEVLAALPRQVQDALVRAAMTEQVSGGLLDALTGRADGAHLLAEAARTTGFVIPVDARPDHYRCHRMLRDLLSARLRSLPDDERLDLHQRAAQWYARHDRPLPALRHALTAGNDELARTLLRDHWADLVPYRPARQGTTLTVPASPPPPPPHELAADPELALAYAVEHLNRPDPAAALGYLTVAADDGHGHRLGDGRRDWLAAACAALRLACHQLATEAHQLATEAAGPRRDTDRLLDTDQLLALAGTVPPAAAIARAVRGAIRLDDGDLTGAERELADGLIRARRTGPRRAAVVCAERLAATYALQGRLRAAEEAARWALDTATHQDVDHPLGYAYLARAVVALHRDRPDEAAANLGLAEQRLDPGRDLVAMLVVAVVRAQLRRDRGDLLAAGQELAQARQHLLGRPTGWPPADWLLAAEAELRVALGDPAAARDLLREAVAGKAVAREAVAAKTATGPAEAAPLTVALARANLAAGDPREAEHLLPESTTSAWPPVWQVEAGLLTAMAARALGDERRAARRLEETLGLAEPDGFRRVLTRSEPPARDLLAAHLDSGTAYWSLVTELLAAGELPAAATPGGRGAHPGSRSATVAAGRGAAGAPPALREPLTERELTVLRYLQSILSNVEIAAELSLSVNTVKTHVRNIYRKLDASRRREAVRRARELHLL